MKGEATGDEVELSDFSDGDWGTDEEEEEADPGDISESSTAYESDEWLMDLEEPLRSTHFWTVVVVAGEEEDEDEDIVPCPSISS